MDIFEQLTKGKYGSFELKHVVGPNLIKGLIVSVLIHSAVVASPLIMELFKKEDDAPRRVVVLDPTMLKKLRRQRPDSPEQITIARPRIAPPQAAIPIAVPEEEVMEEEELMPTQEEIADFVTAGDDALDTLGLEGGDVEFVLEEIEEAIPELGEFTPFEVPPQPLPDFSPQPDYPELAKISRQKGKVIAQVYVDKEGIVRKYEIVQAKPEGLGFEEEVEKVITKWRFTPAIQQGNPVGVWVAIPFNFKFKE